jgi:alpha-D-xyloside xylohydrolase
VVCLSSTVLARCVLIAMAVVCVAGCGASHREVSAGPGPLAWAVHDGPFRVDVLSASHKLTELGGDAPLTYTTSDGREHQLTRVLSSRPAGAGTTVELGGDQPRRTASLTLRPTRTGLAVSLKVTPAKDVAAIRFTLAARASAHFLGSGERTKFVDLQKTVQPLKVWNGCDSSAPAPFFASTDGFGASVRSTAVGRMAFPDALDDTNFACDLDTPQCSVGPVVEAVRICVKTASATIDITRGSLQQVVSAYVKRTGLPRAPWLPQFALMQWRDEVSGPADLLHDIHELQSLNLPVGWVILDNPWEEGARNGCYGLLRFDPTHFPDPAGMIRRVHAAGVRFMLWVSPQLRRAGCNPPGSPDGWMTGDDQVLVRDLTNPAERADFVRRLGLLAKLGVDGFKGDRGDEIDLEKDTLVGGSGVLFQNAYPLLFAKAVAAAIKPYRRHWASLFRSAAPGSAAVLPGFVGEDRTQTWDGLYDAIREAQTAGLAGEAMWGADIGGYQGGDLTSELLGRWAQFAALTPIFEVGGAGANATFWRLGAGAVRRFRAAATLHYELVPYLFQLMARASRTGLPPVLPLGLTWPDDENAWSADAEFTVGENLLAAPVILPAKGANATSQVYLPAGHWIDFFTGQEVDGGHRVTRTSTPTDFPLYVRSGSALAANLRSPAVWGEPWRVNDLIRPGRQGWLVAPARGSVASARTQGATLSATEPKDGEIAIVLHGAAREQQVVVLGSPDTCRVLLDGHAVPRAPTAAALRERSAGWMIEPAPRRAVVVKSTVHRTARIELQAC